MRIDLRRAYIGVPQQRLHCPDITATAQLLGGKTVAKSMTTGWFVQVGLPDGMSDRFLYGTDVNVMANNLSSLIHTKRCRWEQPLPLKGTPGIGVLAS